MSTIGVTVACAVAAPVSVGGVNVKFGVNEPNGSKASSLNSTPALALITALAFVAIAACAEALADRLTWPSTTSTTGTGPTWISSTSSRSGTASSGVLGSVHDACPLTVAASCALACALASNAALIDRGNAHLTCALTLTLSDAPPLTSSVAPLSQLTLRLIGTGGSAARGRLSAIGVSVTSRSPAGTTSGQRRGDDVRDGPGRRLGHRGDPRQQPVRGLRSESEREHLPHAQRLGSGERDLAGLAGRRRGGNLRSAHRGDRCTRRSGDAQRPPGARHERAPPAIDDAHARRHGLQARRHAPAQPARPPRSGLTCRTRAVRDGVRDSSTTRARDPAPTTRTPTLSARAPSTPYAALTTGRVRPAADRRARPQRPDSNCTHHRPAQPSHVHRRAALPASLGLRLVASSSRAPTSASTAPSSSSPGPAAMPARGAAARLVTNETSSGSAAGRCAVGFAGCVRMCSAARRLSASGKTAWSAAPAGSPAAAAGSFTARTSS